MVSPYQLLMQGARMLHFKYTYYDGEWFATHNILGREFALDVLDVLKFLDEHPGEVVILFLQSTYFGENQSLDSFHDWLATVEYNGKTIYDFVHYDEVNVFGSEFSGGVTIDDLTYNDVTQNGTSAGVVLMDRREYEIPEGETEESDFSAYFSTSTRMRRTNGTTVWGRTCWRTIYSAMRWKSAARGCTAGNCV